MYSVIYDHQLVAIDRNVATNVSDSLVFRDKKGILHMIDFASCAQNYRKEKRLSSSRCIGERNLKERYFVIYTTGVKTQIIFKKRMVFSFGKRKLLHGSRLERILQFQQKLKEMQYTMREMKQ